MKLIYCFIFFLLPAFLKAQKNPIDTTFYSQGVIKSIRYKTDYKYGYAVKRSFKKSKNYLDFNQPLIDTMFDNSYPDKADWTCYQGYTRIHLNKYSNVYIQKSTKYGSQKDPVFSKINGSFTYPFVI